MPAQLETVRHEVKHADDAGAVNSRQTVQFFHDGSAFRFVVGTAYQVGNAVDNRQLDAAEYVVVVIHTVADGLQAFAARHSRQVIRFQPIGFHGFSAPFQQKSRIFIELVFRLFGIVQQNGFSGGIALHGQSQRIGFKILFRQRAGYDCRGVIAFSGSFAAGNAEQVALRAERYAVHADDVFRQFGRIFKIYFAGADECHCLGVFCF